MRTRIGTSDGRYRRSLLQMLLAASTGLALARCGTPSDGQLEAAATEPARLEAAVSGQWSPAIVWPQSAVHTHLLPTGKVLFTSEFAFGDDPRIWDPATDEFTAVPGVDYNPFCAGHSFLADGTLLVAGGHAASHVGLSYASIFDPATSTWSRIPPMNGPRWYPTTATLPTGEALVLAGETNGPGNNNPLPQVWQPETRTWRDLVSAQMSIPYYPRTIVGPDGRVFVAGPARMTRYLDTQGTGAWMSVGNMLYGPNRTYGTAVLYDEGKVLIAGGGDPPTATAEVIDLKAPSPTWRNVAPMGIARRQLNATVLPDGKVLVTGGSSGSGFDNHATPVFQAELWDPATEAWTPLASASVYRGYHSTALLLPDGRVLVAGGRGEVRQQIFSPPYLFRGARPAIASAPASVQPGESFLVGTPDAASVAQVSFVRLGSVTHSFNQNQRFVRLAFSPAAGGVRVSAPPNNALAPPGHYLLFLVNRAGVPSVAKIVRFGTGSGVTPPPPPPAPPPPVTTTLRAIAFGDVWKYDDRGVDNGIAWLAANFDDSGWKQGAGQLGYGDGDETTVLFRATPRQPSVYFRKNIAVNASVTAASLQVLYDDGAAVWVNGTLVFSKNMDRGLAYSTSASASAENELARADISAAPFVAGDNVVAVMVKQVGPTSPDVSFALQLDLTIAAK